MAANVLSRAVRHLFAGSGGKLYPEASLQRIAAAIAEGETTHRGQVVFAVEPGLPLHAVLRGRTARERAGHVFSHLRVWDTEANNGVLIYLLVADHRIEILADRGLAARVGDAQWREVCTLMETRLKSGDAEAAAIAGVQAVSALLAAHFPRGAGDESRNELSDRPYLFD
jgi:uncharacterized membrane protein